MTDELDELECGCDPKRLAAARDAWRPLNDQQAFVTLHSQDKRHRQEIAELEAALAAASARDAAFKAWLDEEIAYWKGVERTEHGEGYLQGLIVASKKLAELQRDDAPAKEPDARTAALVAVARKADNDLRNGKLSRWEVADALRAALQPFEECAEAGEKTK